MKHEILDSIPFFSVLEKEELATLALHMEFHLAPKHGLIYAEGEVADYFYILSEGSIKIGTHHEDGREVIKQVLHPRMVFGEFALIGQNEVHHNFAMALSPATGYYRIRVDIFRQMMDKNPQLTMGVVSLIGLKLRQTENQLESLIFKDARARIIDFIIENANQCGRQVGLETLLKHSLTQQDIANYTGTSRQTVTAVLNDLRKTNKIYFTRSSILIRDLAALA
ncbi:MAG TPA: Crp/Fnr family transcriptional regulator [Saprospiraceae bacterium]|jgi:CRP-like cAMP-binding protein|nr:Crp/Fnr family transcriptional regulator [Saprospiraceae bacterium]